MSGIVRQLAITRFEAFCMPEPMSGCIIWMGAISSNGYGHFWFNRKPIGAHVWAWVAANGPLPQGLQIDHLCRNRPCVNARHLEAVTGRVNTLRGNTITAANSRKTHCPIGHELNGVNLIRVAGRRVCRECKNSKRRRPKGF